MGRRAPATGAEPMKDRCRNCEEPIDVLDLCEICEMKPTLIEPVKVKVCRRGHFMDRRHSGWVCNVCQRMRQGKQRARIRERLA